MSTAPPNTRFRQLRSGKRRCTERMPESFHARVRAAFKLWHKERFGFVPSFNG